MFGAGVIPGIVLSPEFSEPQRAVMFDDSLRARAAHGSTDQEQVFDRVVRTWQRVRIVRDDGVGLLLESCQVDGSIETALRRRGGYIQTEAQCAGAVVGSLQEVVEFFEPGAAGMFFDDAPPPPVRHGVADGAEEPAHAGCFERAASEAQFDRIEFHGIGALEVPAAIDEGADRYAIGCFCDAQTRRGDERGRVRRHNVDIALPLRSHCPAPVGGGPVSACGRAPVSCLPRRGPGLPPLVCHR